MKQNLTIFAKGVVYLMGVAVVAVLAILLPELAREEAVGKVNHPSALPYLVGAWVLSVPIFIALYQTLKLLRLVDRNRTFSNHSVKALHTIQYCSVLFGALIIAGATTVVFIAHSADPTEDVAPIITFGFIFTLVSSIFATFIAVLKKLVADAIDIKSENDLIV